MILQSDFFCPEKNDFCHFPKDYLKEWQINFFLGNFSRKNEEFALKNAPITYLEQFFVRK